MGLIDRDRVMAQRPVPSPYAYIVVTDADFAKRAMVPCPLGCGGNADITMACDLGATYLCKKASCDHEARFIDHGSAG